MINDVMGILKGETEYIVEPEPIFCVKFKSEEQEQIFLGDAWINSKEVEYITFDKEEFTLFQRGDFITMTRRSID